MAWDTIPGNLQTGPYQGSGKGPAPWTSGTQVAKAKKTTAKPTTKPNASDADARAERSAKQTVVEFLTQFGLQDLAEWAWGVYQDAGGGSAAFDQIRLDLPEQAAFKARFPAYDALAKAGKAMSPAEMIAYEKTARSLFQQAGLPPGFYDDPNDFAQFMIHDVSPQELQQRIGLAQSAVLTAPAEVRAQLETLYGVNQGELTAFFLDPDRALPLVTQRYTAATLAGAAQRTGFGQLSQSQAERVTALGVSEDQAQQGFGQLAEMSGLFEAQVQGETQIDQDAQIAATFGGDAAARLAFQRRQQARKAAFSGSAGLNVTQSGVRAIGEKNKAV